MTMLFILVKTACGSKDGVWVRHVRAPGSALHAAALGAALCPLATVVRFVLLWDL